MFTFFARRAMHEVSVVLWPGLYGRKTHRWAWFGSLGFWLVLGLFWAIWVMFKFEAWLVLVAAILVAQLAVTVVQAIYWTFAYPVHKMQVRGERRFKSVT